MKKKFTIKDLAEGRCAVRNDGTFEELKRILKLAFPNDNVIPSVYSKYYYKSDERPHQWTSTDYLSKMEAQSVKDFLNEYPKIMEVSESPNFPEEHTYQRVVFMEKNGKYLAWKGAETFEEAEKTSNVIIWYYARDVEDTSEM